MVNWLRSLQWLVCILNVLDKPWHIFHPLLPDDMFANFAPNTQTPFGRQYQWLCQSVRVITITMSQKRQTFLLGDSDRLRSVHLQRCATHSSINLTTTTTRLLDWMAVSILVWGKQWRTRMTYNSSGTYLYMIKSLLLLFWLKESTRRCVTSPFWISSGHCHFISFRGLAGIINSGKSGLTHFGWQSQWCTHDITGYVSLHHRLNGYAGLEWEGVW